MKLLNLPTFYTMEFIPRLAFDDFNEFKDFVIRNDKLLWFRTVDSIKYAFNNDALQAILFEVVLEFEPIDQIIKLQMPRKSWEESLTRALKFFEGIENYEVCAEIRDLINTIILEDYGV